MTCSSGADTRVNANKDTDEVRSERVGQVVDEVSVFARRSIAGGWTFGLRFRGRVYGRLFQLLLDG